MSSDKSKKEYLDKLRHSAAHLLAAAVLELYPKTKPTLGPPIDNGFYYDFEFPQNISEEDLPKIEKKMKELVKHWKGFEKQEVTAKEAKAQFKHNKYKKELIDQFSSPTRHPERPKGVEGSHNEGISRGEISRQARNDKNEQSPLTLYSSGGFTDLCRGGHIENPAKELRVFKLLSIAGAYWRGDEKNTMLTRIYGTAFPTKKELDDFLNLAEEARKRDHRKIGRELDLFLISQEVGGGLPIFAPKGWLLKKALEDFVIGEKRKRDYQFVWTPHIAHSNIYRKSGHWQKYDAMFTPMQVDNEDYVLKPMNCPHHFQVYLLHPRSYRELPLRIAENGTCYRNEKSGELSGLLRVRSLTVDDTHTFVRHAQIGEEIDRVLGLIEYVYKTLGFSNYLAQVSIRDPKDKKKYLGNEKTWERAERALIDAVKKRKISYVIEEGEAAFYGPKIDVMVKDSLGREWQLSTIQLDFNQPENFDLSYTNEKGKEERPAILHIAVLGSVERFLGILIEHYAGAFPLWLSPVQVQIIPVGADHVKFSHQLAAELKAENILVEVDDANETVGNKIRKASKMKVPYMLVVGDKEVKGDKLTVRQRGDEEQREVSKKKFVENVLKDIKEKAIW